MPGRSLQVCAAALLLSPLAGCATFQLVGSWQNPNVAPPHYSSVVIFATAREITSRNIFEDAFVSLAQQHGVQATQGYNVVSESQNTTAQELEAGVRQSGAQAAIVATAIRTSVTTQTGPTYTDPYGGPNWQPGYYGYYSTGWMEWSPTSTTTTMMVQLKINVYEAASQQLVWSGITDTVAQDQVSNQAVPIAKMFFDALWTRTILVPHHG
jgi:uncharacterized protein YbjQ (UPF0145 family)